MLILITTFTPITSAIISLSNSFRQDSRHAAAPDGVLRGLFLGEAGNHSKFGRSAPLLALTMAESFKILDVTAINYIQGHNRIHGSGFQWLRCDLNLLHGDVSVTVKEGMFLKSRPRRNKVFVEMHAQVLPLRFASSLAQKFGRHSLRSK
ncbi:hypothetical protein BHE74_00020465 [Ensete ventricosum]|nr:hypothetical protein GW17_00008323 [Ensete ventricosum]RWW71767.1 hypothetical protein BHE74_00020465 [Ensete ventricosum]RZR93861.1 hypothetical protein BHM03_00022440 [Ensete ventricosum]